VEIFPYRGMVYPRNDSTDFDGLSLLRTFGDGCPKAFMLRAVMRLSPFLGYRSNNFFNSMREAEEPLPKVI
jgi:hypothetical protein